MEYLIKHPTLSEAALSSMELNNDSILAEETIPEDEEKDASNNTIQPDESQIAESSNTRPLASTEESDTVSFEVITFLISQLIEKKGPKEFMKLICAPIKKARGFNHDTEAHREMKLYTGQPQGSIWRAIYKDGPLEDESKSLCIQYIFANQSLYQDILKGETTLPAQSLAVAPNNLGVVVTPVEIDPNAETPTQRKNRVLNYARRVGAKQFLSELAEFAKQHFSVTSKEEAFRRLEFFPNKPTGSFNNYASKNHPFSPRMIEKIERAISKYPKVFNLGFESARKSTVRPAITPSDIIPVAISPTLNSITSPTPQTPTLPTAEYYSKLSQKDLYTLLKGDSVIGGKAWVSIREIIKEAHGFEYYSEVNSTLGFKKSEANNLNPRLLRQPPRALS